MAEFTYTQGQDTNLQGNLFFSFSTLTRLVQGLLKALNHLNFFSLLCFRESGIFSRHQIIIVPSHFSTFASFILLSCSLPLNPKKSGAKPAPRAG